jgi:hypothetical protein
MSKEHFERCKAHALGHADVLIGRIRMGQINASAFEGLMESFLDLPTYRDYRAKLLALAKTRFDGRPRP